MATCHCFCASYNVEIKDEVISLRDIDQSYLIFLFPFLLQLFSLVLKKLTVKSYHDLSFPYPCPAGKQISQPCQGSISADITSLLTPTAVNIEKAQGSASAGLANKLTPTADIVEKAYVETVVTPGKQDVIDKVENIENVAHGVAEKKAAEEAEAARLAAEKAAVEKKAAEEAEVAKLAAEKAAAEKPVADRAAAQEAFLKKWKENLMNEIDKIRRERSDTSVDEKQSENARQRRRQRRQNARTRPAQLHVVSNPLPPCFSIPPQTTAVSFPAVVTCCVCEYGFFVHSSGLNCGKQELFHIPDKHGRSGGSAGIYITHCPNIPPELQKEWMCNACKRYACVNLPYTKRIKCDEVKKSYLQNRKFGHESNKKTNIDNNSEQNYVPVRRQKFENTYVPPNLRKLDLKNWTPIINKKIDYDSGYGGNQYEFCEPSISSNTVGETSSYRTQDSSAYSCYSSD